MSPVIVGHSISAGIASIYAASYPVRGLVNVEGTVDIRPIAALVQRLAPDLRSKRFAAARTDPSDLQAEIDREMERIAAPCLNVFGHALSDHERNYLHDHVADVFIEEWPDRGHHVHLAEADRFAAHLRSFIDRCRRDGERPNSGRETVTARRGG